MPRARTPRRSCSPASSPRWADSATPSWSASRRTPMHDPRTGESGARDVPVAGGPGEGDDAGLTADGADSSGMTIFGDIGRERLEQAGRSWRLLPELDPHRPPSAGQLDGVDAVLSFGHVPFDA